MTVLGQDGLKSQQGRGQARACRAEPQPALTLTTDTKFSISLYFQQTNKVLAVQIKLRS